MAQYPSLPLWTDAYLGDTNHLTTIEHGAYLLLLITMWRSKDGKLKNDDKLLARYCRCNSSQWRKMKPILMEFFDEKDGFITQGRMLDEIKAVKQLSHKQSKKARDRWLKNKKTVDATAMPEACRNDASPSPSPSPVLPPNPQGGNGGNSYQKPNQKNERKKRNGKSNIKQQALELMDKYRDPEPDHDDGGIL